MRWDITLPLEEGEKNIGDEEPIGMKVLTEPFSGGLIDIT